MRLRRHEHNENPLDVVRAAISRMKSSKPLGEAEDGKSASTVADACKVCGSMATQKIRIPRHKRDPISRCPECGRNTGSGSDTVSGSSNYSGDAGANYDESMQSRLLRFLTDRMDHA